MAGLIQPKGTEHAKDGSAQPAPELDGGISITPGAVPGLLNDLQRLYVSGLGLLATEILRDHALAPAGYTLNTKYARVDLEDDSFASAGSEHLHKGIDWSDTCRKNSTTARTQTARRLSQSCSPSAARGVPAAAACCTCS